MPGRSRVRTGLLCLGLLFVIGSAWFYFDDDYSLIDATYQAAMTLTTVGFGEVHPFDANTRVFATVFMIVGVAAAFFTLGGVFEELLEHQLTHFGRRRMDRRIASMAGHAVVCGYGRVGERVAEVVAGRGGELVVVDSDEQRVARAVEHGYPAVLGDSTDDDTLRDAGVGDAASLVVSLASDADAISTVLSARVLSAELRIVSRANVKASEAKLLRAGADRVVNPLSQGADRIAAFAQQPSVADFLDVVVHDGSLEYRLEELAIPPGSPIADLSLADAHIRSRSGSLVLALRKPDGEFLSNPAPEVDLRSGDTLIVIGTEGQLQTLEGLVQGQN